MKLKFVLIIIVCLLVTICGLYINNVLIESNAKTQNTSEYNMQKFDLRDKIKLKPEYQIRATYKSCYAYATLDSIETYLLLHN